MPAGSASTLPDGNTLERQGLTTGECLQRRPQRWKTSVKFIADCSRDFSAEHCRDVDPTKRCAAEQTSWKDSRAAAQRIFDCGTATATGGALRRRGDNTSCNPGDSVIFHPCFVFAPCSRPISTAWSHASGAWDGKRGQSHEIPRDSAGVFDRALQGIATVLPAVPRSDYRSNAITAREHE